MISDTISSIQTNLENAYDELESKGATIPANKNIQNLADAIASIKGENFAKYHIEQIINGDTSELIITDYNGQPTNNYLVGTITDGDTQQMYIVDENERKISNLKDFIDIRGAAYLFYGYNGEPLDNILSYSDTSDVTDMQNMFQRCQLSSVPLFDTSKVTNMSSMFAGSKINSYPIFNTSSVNTMSFMFQQNDDITDLRGISSWDTSNVTNMSYMFFFCNNLVYLPLFDTSGLINASGMFGACKKITSIPAYDFSNVTNMSSTFSSCDSLEEIHAYGMKVNFNIADSTLYTEAALVEILNNLATVLTTQTLTMGATNLAKLTAAEIAIATNKGWTLA